MSRSRANCPFVRAVVKLAAVLALWLLTGQPASAQRPFDGPHIPRDAKPFEAFRIWQEWRRRLYYYRPPTPQPAKPSAPQAPPRSSAKPSR
jgi:hypothetical protein